MARGKSIMFYIYYKDNGTITSVAAKLNKNYGPNYIEIDLETFEEFTIGSKRTFDYIIIENAKITGKMHIIPRDLDKHTEIVQLTGIISKQALVENSFMLNQNITDGTWTASSTLSDINCAMFAQGYDHLKQYYVVDPANRFILLDTFEVNLKTLAADNIIAITNYNKDICKQNVSLLCKSHHVNHIHTVED
jgi:hypothetical protein